MTKEIFVVKLISGLGIDKELFMARFVTYLGVVNIHH